MWSILIIVAFCISFWLFRREDTPVNDSKDSKENKDMGPLAALYFAGFWEDDDAIH